MNRILLATAVVAALLSAPAFAEGTELPLDDATKAQITTLLTEQGYEVRKIQIEDGEYEAYAIKDGKKLEIFLDKDMKIVRTKG